eukprot:Ihof_evm1s445 gene=Ihof_evmTU1s445
MIDIFTVFTTGGIVLWTYTGPYAVGNATESKRGSGGTQEYTHGPFLVKWVLDNDNDLIFVVVIQEQLQAQLTYLDELLDKIRHRFSNKYKAYLEANKSPATYISTLPGYFSFDTEFAKLDRDLEVKTREERSKPREMRRFGESIKAKKLADKNLRKVEDDKTSTNTSTAASINPTPKVGSMEEEETVSSKLEWLKRRQDKAKKLSDPKGSSSIETSPTATGNKGKKEKIKREWHGDVSSKNKAKDFDYSSQEGKEDADNQKIKMLVSEVAGRGMVGDVMDLEEGDQSEDDAQNAGVQ